MIIFVSSWSAQYAGQGNSDFWLIASAKRACVTRWSYNYKSILFYFVYIYIYIYKIIIIIIMTTGFIFTCVFCRDMKALICSGNGTSFNSKKKSQRRWLGVAPPLWLWSLGWVGGRSVGLSTASCHRVVLSNLTLPHYLIIIIY